MNAIRVTLAAVAVMTVGAFASPSAHAYEPTIQTVRNDVFGALNLCKPYVRDDKSPGLVSDQDYYEYTNQKASALAADPKAFEWDQLHMGIVAKELFPKCEKLMAAYAAGVDAEKTPALSGPCKHNVESRLKSITDNYYPAFLKDRTASGQAWFARKELEAARFYMYRKEGWPQPLGSGCAINDSYKKAFAPLKTEFAAAEALVKKIEAGRGVTFVKVEQANNHILFLDVKTHKPVAKSDDY